MLTPTFRVTQNGQFVIVLIDLPSIHCRISAAEFDILPDQFTFHCHPYYLRLVFTLPASAGGCHLVEGKGEKAEYDLATHTLQVFLPKSVAGVEFPNLHLPNMLLATTRQRRKIAKAGGDKKTMVEVVASTNDAESDGSSDEDEDDDLALETEFVQKMGVESAPAGTYYYGFNNEKRGAFTAVVSHDNDAGTSNMAEVLELSVARLGVASPDFVSPLKRRQERLMRETEEFNVEEYWACMEDEDGEIDSLMRTIHNKGAGGGRGEGNGLCWYRATLETGLRTSGISFVGGKHDPPVGVEEDDQYTIPVHAVEDDEDDANAGAGTAVQGLTSGTVTAWLGNTGKVSTAHGDSTSASSTVALPQGMRTATTAADIITKANKNRDPVALPNGGQRGPQPPRQPGMLAVPSVTPVIAFTADEQRMLQFIEPRWNPATHMAVPPRAMRALWSMPTPDTRDCEKQPDVWCVLVDILLAYVYEHLTTLGDGNVESVWTLTKLSPTLSFLDHPRSIYEAVVGFARRSLIYPLHRHWGLTSRCAADVGALLLCGPYAVIRALLSVKHVFDHTELHHAFNRLYVNEYISFISGCLCNADGSSWVTEQLHRVAVELHSVMTMNTDVVEQIAAAGGPAPAHLLVRLTAGLSEEDISNGTSESAGSSAADGGRSALITSMLNVVPAISGRSVNDRGAALSGAQQLEPLAPMTIGLPISMDEEEEAN